MHRRLGSATLSQLAFTGGGGGGRGERNTNFPWEKSKWDNTVYKEKKKKKEAMNRVVPLTFTALAAET